MTLTDTSPLLALIDSGLADASLVAATEVVGIRRIFTLDSDFYVSGIGGKDAFMKVDVTLGNAYGCA